MASAGCVLDASVVIALWSSRDAHHQDARDLLGQVPTAALLMHAVTAAEVLVGPARLGRTADAERALDELGVRIAAFAPHEVGAVATLRATTRLRLPDVCVLHLAASTGSSLATFDERLAAATVTRGVPLVGVE
jgi:predicted nucleic acid-binding protein